jgi:hypothetical protein
MMRVAAPITFAHLKNNLKKPTAIRINSMTPASPYLRLALIGSAKITKIEIKAGIGSEIIFVLPLGEVSVKLSRLFRYVYKLRDLSAIEQAHSDLCTCIEQGGSALVPVVAAGRGATDKSRKIRVQAIYRSRESQHQEVTREHTITVPVSQLTQRSDGLYAPRWLVSRTLHDRLPGREWPLRIEGGVWEGREQLWNGVFAPLAAELADQAKARQQRIARLEAEQKQKTERDTEQNARCLAVQEELTRQRQQREQKALAKRAQLESLPVERVEWDEWVKVRNGYGGKSDVKKTHIAENCLLQFSGQRVYINLPNGNTVIKLRRNVRFGDEGLSPVMEA